MDDNLDDFEVVFLLVDFFEDDVFFVVFLGDFFLEVVFFC